MAALYHCESGQLIYGAWRRMEATSKAELHIQDAVRETVIPMSQGLNLLIPLSAGEVLIETAAVKRAPVDPMLGDLSLEETGGGLVPQGDTPFHLYVEDIIWDPKGRKELRRSKGTLGRREIQDGKIMSYAMDKTIYEFDPLTGKRRRLHDISPSFAIGDPILQLPRPTYYFSSGLNLFSVVGADSESRPMAKSIDSNSIYKFNSSDRQWKSVAKLTFEPRWALLDSGVIFAVGRSRVGIYEISSGQLSERDMELNGYEPTSVARVGEYFALGVAKHANDPDRPATDVQIWILGKEMNGVVLKHPMKDFGRLTLSSQSTPLPVSWN